MNENCANSMVGFWLLVIQTGHMKKWLTDRLLLDIYVRNVWSPRRSDDVNQKWSHCGCTTPAEGNSAFFFFLTSLKLVYHHISEVQYWSRWYELFSCRLKFRHMKTLLGSVLVWEPGACSFAWVELQALSRIQSVHRGYCCWVWFWSLSSQCRLFNARCSPTMQLIILTLFY